MRGQRERKNEKVTGVVCEYVDREKERESVTVGFQVGLQSLFVQMESA